VTDTIGASAVCAKLFAAMLGDIESENAIKMFGEQLSAILLRIDAKNSRAVIRRGAFDHRFLMRC